MSDLTKTGPAAYGTAQLLTQPGGLFSVAGMDRTVVSAHIAPQGLGSFLPVFASNLDDPRYGVLTGFGPETGSEANYPCDDAPTGYIKGGTLTAAFGRVMRQTRTIEIDKLLHEQRGANTQLQLLGQMLGNGNMATTGMSQAQMLDLVIQSEMVTVGVGFERKLAKMVWQGNPSLNGANGGYKEFPGLDLQIATGHKDAETGTTMPSVDSLIFDFAKNMVTGTAPDIVNQLSWAMYSLEDVADRTGMNPVQFAIVMRRELWFEVTSLWPCRYMANGCDSNGLFLTNDSNVLMRDSMRNGMYLTINGKNYPVILDDGIAELNSTNAAGIAKGAYASSIYIVPIKINGNMPTTYWEYVDYRQVSAQLAPLGTGQRNTPFWTESGRLLWVYRDNGFCFDLQAKIEPRIVLRTPHLAAKIQNIAYMPMGHLRDSDPLSSYFKNGGIQYLTPVAGQSVWR